LGIGRAARAGAIFDHLPRKFGPDFILALISAVLSKVADKFFKAPWCPELRAPSRHRMRPE
jgi:hypothetical protein